MSPTRRPGAHARGLRLKLVLAFYVLAAALLPLAHHDVVCHFKSSTHCTTCVIGSTGESASEPADVAAAAFKDAGEAAGTTVAHVQSVPHTDRSGRAPPSVA